MNTGAPCCAPAGTISRRARECIERPLFRGGWFDAVFLHYEMDPAALRPYVPYPLDLREGRAYVSLVLFSLNGLCCDLLPRATRLLLRPISDHAFLNVRTYVRVGETSGIYFLAEWLSNPLSVPFGRPAFGLPYHFARFDRSADRMSAAVWTRRGNLRFHASLAPDRHFAACETGSLDEFLVERYTAFTQWEKMRRFFRVWHPPWPVAPITATIDDAGLLDQTGAWPREARLIGAHYSPGVADVWMGAPEWLPRDDPHAA